MTQNLTRGGLKPAMMKNLKDTGDVVHCMFNPFEYSITKANTWEREAQSGQDSPDITFKKGGPMRLTLTLYFDTLAANKDVREHTNKLWKMMMVHKPSQDATSGKGQPPNVAFEWGRLYFEAIITNMTQKFTLFTPEGMPVRANVQVTLEQAFPADEFPEQEPAALSAPAVQAVTVTQGDRIDNIAAQTGDPSNYRALAEQNNVDNPLNIVPGQTLVPPAPPAPPTPAQAKQAAQQAAQQATQQAVNDAFRRF